MPASRLSRRQNQRRETLLTICQREQRHNRAEAYAVRAGDVDAVDVAAEDQHRLQLQQRSLPAKQSQRQRRLRLRW